MKKILIILSLTLLTTGCLSESEKVDRDPLNLFNDEPATMTEDSTAENPLGIMQESENTQATSLEQKEFLFEKNQECLKYKNGIAKKLLEKDSSFFGDTSLERQRSHFGGF